MSTPMYFLLLSLVNKAAALGPVQCRIGQGQNPKQIEEDRGGRVRETNAGYQMETYQ